MRSRRKRRRCRYRASTAGSPSAGRNDGAEHGAPRRRKYGLTRLDAADVRVAAAAIRGGVAPVALDLPGLAADRDEAVERPCALVRVLVALPILPGVDLRVGEHL